jgi:gluconate 2-dehydrogenase alpha chain
MQTLKKTDVVVIGLGAAGGFASLGLVRKGIEVIGLEAGPRRTSRDFPLDEIRNDVRNHMGAPKFNREIPTYRPNDTTPTIPAFGFPMVNGVGGGSIHYGMATWRYAPWSFEMRSQTLARYGASMLPAGSLVEDWPLSYQDLEPYYDAVEYEIGASGQAGNINGHIDPRGNVFEGPRTRGYPLPPLRSSGWTELAYSGAKKMGLHPCPGPAAIHSEPYRGNPACTYCGFCTSNGCYVNAKGSTFLNAIPEAEDSGRLTVVPNARVLRITVDADGRARGVDYRSGGQTYHQPASVVVLSCYVYENVRLLLLSKSKAYPNGLSNNRGQVGVGYISHIYGGASGLFEGRRLNVYGGPGAQCTWFDDFDDDNFDHKGLGFIGGGGMATGPELKPIAAAWNTPPTLPQWGPEWKQWLARNAVSVGTVGFQAESLPYESNRLDLDPVAKDDLGIPRIRITLAPMQQQEQLRVNFLTEKSTQWLQEMGASQVWPAQASNPPMNNHAFGGARMGTNPDNSVVDKWLLSHEVPNLAILGGGTFPSSTGRNPTQTIEALALRTGEHIAENWTSIAA